MMLLIHKKFHINPLSANPDKWSNNLKQFVVYRRIVWVCLTILVLTHKGDLPNEKKNQNVKAIIIVYCEKISEI